MTTIQDTPPAKKHILPNIILLLCLGALLCGEAYFGYHIHALSTEQSQIKEDYAMTNNITFGLFSVDQWRDKMSAVVNHQVTDFKMSRAQKKQLQAQIEQQLNGLINQTVAEINKPQKTFAGRLKKIAFNSMVDADAIHAQVPSFAKTIIDKVNSPASTNRIKNILSTKLNELESQTYDSTSVAAAQVTQYLYTKYHVADDAAFNKQISARLAFIHKLTLNYTYYMLACVIAALLLWTVMRKTVHLHTSLFIMSILFALVLLAVGSTASIIEVDARIRTLNFGLMGEKVSFDNQVLFFQSKSIVGIIQVLLSQPKPDSVMVGILIMLFILILPVVRLLAKGIYILSPESIGNSGVVRYLAFEAGKWDMADVMIVGTLMTYIGLNGIIKSQLSNLNMQGDSLNLLTENDSSLQPGYFIFAGYVIYAMILSGVLKNISNKEVVESE